MKKIKIISVLSIIMMCISSIVSALAVSAYLYSSDEVSYDNTSSGISATNVQGAIDELYADANNYSSINTRVTSLESKWPSNSESSLL